MAIKDIEWAIGFWKDRSADYKTYRAYYDGDHPLLFATEKFRNTFGSLFREFSDNLCPTIVDVPSDRLRIDGWDGQGAEQAQELYDDPLLGMPRLFNQTFKDAACVGDAYILVWPDEDEESDTYEDPVFWPHDADQMAVRYSEDNPNRIEVAAKQWLTRDKRGRVNLYFDDGSIEKYATRRKCTSGTLPDKQAAWERLKDDVKSDEPDVESDYGMPVFHFGHDARVGDYGTSVLKDVLPVQDALNKSVCDLLVDMEFIAFPQRYATGLQVETDEATGKVKNAPFTPGVDRVWTGGTDVKFGEFSVGDLGQFIDVQESFRAEMARISGLPTHYLNLDAMIPTGEGLRVCEARLIAGLINDQDTYQRPAVGVLHQGMKILGKSSDRAKFKPVWADPNPHNPMLDAETQVVKQAVGISQRQSLREMRYTDKQITEMEGENEAEEKKKMAAALAAAPAGGGLPGQPPGPGDTKGRSGSPAGGSQPRQKAAERNGSPGRASKPAPRQQQRRRPVATP